MAIEKLEKKVGTKVGDCPFASWEFWDMRVSTDRKHGEYVCAHPFGSKQSDEYGGPCGKPVCEVEDYRSCPCYSQAC